MALRYLAGNLRVPAAAALWRAQKSRGAVASRSSQLGSGKEGVNVEVPRATSELRGKEELQRRVDGNEDFIRRISEASSSRERQEMLETLSVASGAVMGLFVGSLILRYENRNGEKISNWLLGLPTK